MKKHTINKESTRILSVTVLLLFLLIVTNPSSKVGHLLAVLIIFLVAYLVYQLFYFVFKVFGKREGNYKLISVLVATTVATAMGFSSIGQLNGLEGLLLISAMFLFGFYMARYKK